MEFSRYRRYTLLSFEYLALAVFFSGCLFGTTKTISGSIIGPDNTVLNQVCVTTDPPTKSVFTDSLGRFVITGVSNGDYVVKAQKSGYMENRVSINVGGSDVTQADIQLDALDKPSSVIELPMSDSKKAEAAPSTNEKKENDGKNNGKDEKKGKKDKWYLE